VSVQRMLFLNIGYMEKYEGLDGDTITGGGSHVNREGWGGEIMNFLSYQGHMYGCVQPNRFGTINVARLGAAQGADAVSGVLVVWVAPRPQVGNVVVGWYENARVFRAPQAPREKRRMYHGSPLEFHVMARQGDCRLLGVDLRTLQVPRAKNADSGQGMGQANVWYADKADELKRNVLLFITRVKSGVALPPEPDIRTHRRGTAWQPDPTKRLKVEQAAILAVAEHYSKLGYTVESFERDRVGWDLEARRGAVLLKLEVKGLSGDDAVADLTPNEYSKCLSDKHRDSYRICIVTSALTKAKLRIFMYSPEEGRWIGEDGCGLDFEEIVAARVYARAIRGTL
jgi:hypothetical protein